jgi:SAM-dependent methyltransferase
MWGNYETEYRHSLRDPAFLTWRELGARRKAENIMRVCRELNPVSVAEIGCGTGSVLRMLHSMNFAHKYCCVDLSPSAVSFARDSCSAFTSLAVASTADALPFPDGAFDLTILSHVIEHLDNPLSALSESSRVARFIVVEVPTEKVFSNFVRTRILHRPYPSLASAGHVQFWSPSSIATFLEREAGLEIVNRHTDLLDENLESCNSTGDSTCLVKRGLQTLLPSFIYARLLTTHATFLCRTSGIHL